MNGLCGILFLIIVRTVSAGIILQPIYPFETDVTKFKLLEKFFPESDRDALPIVRFLEKFRAPDQDLTPPDADSAAFFATRRDLASPKATRRDLPPPPERPDAPPRGDPFPYPQLKVFLCVQKPPFPGRPWSGRKAIDGEDEAPEMNDILTTSLLKVAQKMARVMEKKLSAMNFVAE